MSKTRKGNLIEAARRHGIHVVDYHGTFRFLTEDLDYFAAPASKISGTVQGIATAEVWLDGFIAGYFKAERDHGAVEA